MKMGRDREVPAAKSAASHRADDWAGVTIDPHKAIVFPNRMREQRRAHGYLKLLRFAAVVPEIPYIRLSKIERGEVFPRADELRRIGSALGISAADLLIDIDAPGFDLDIWAQPFAEGKIHDDDEERFAALLGAALRARRTLDPDLSIAAIERDFGLPPVNLSRVENAAKTFARWNPAIRNSLFALFGVADETALRAHVAAEHRRGILAPFLAAISNPEERRARTRAKTAQLAGELSQGAAPPPAPADLAPPSLPGIHPAPAPSASVSRLLPVHGTPLPGGAIALTMTGEQIEAPRNAGPNAFALRVCRQTLGGGLPGQAIVFVDPARYPVAGGLAAIREGEAYRLLAVTIDRDGALSGYSLNPEITVSIDGRDPAEVAAVIGAIFP